MSSSHIAIVAAEVLQAAENCNQYSASTSDEKLVVLRVAASVIEQTLVMAATLEAMKRSMPIPKP